MSWQPALAAAIGARVVHAEPVTGGDINEAYRVRLDDGRVVFVKTHAQVPPDLFAAEARALDWLRPGPLRVPGVVAVGPTFLALEWLDVARKGPGFEAAFGRGLALLHQLGAPGYGLDHATYLATLPQPAVAEPHLPTFWVEHRLRPVCARAHTAGHLPDVSGKLDALRARADRFGPAEPAARLHGDLWWGNVIAVAGAPALVDPASYGGPREVDLAMLALFGEVSSALVDAYSEVWPLAPDWRTRIPLWQLYPLAVHATLFGGSYGAQVTRALDGLLA